MITKNIKQFLKNNIPKYLKIKYKHLGRGYEYGDCWNLIILFYRNLGYNIKDYTHYEEDWSRRGKNYFIENYHEQWEKIDNIEIGNAILFQNNRGICDHIGIFIGDGKFLHTSRAGTVISKLNRTNRKVYGYFRPRCLN